MPAHLVSLDILLIDATLHTRTAKHSDEFTGATSVITDGDHVVEHTVIDLCKVRKDINQMVGSCFVLARIN